jgi:hypothetical protein
MKGDMSSSKKVGEQTNSCWSLGFTSLYLVNAQTLPKTVFWVSLWRHVVFCSKISILSLNRSVELLRKFEKTRNNYNPLVTMDLHKPGKIQEFLLVLSSFLCLFEKTRVRLFVCFKSKNRTTLLYI